MKVSIITLTLDKPEFFGEAMASIPAISPVDIEHIIVHDGDPAFAEEIAHRYPATKIVMGDGKGATAALAQGVEAATGDFLLILHSDDRLVPEALARLAECAAVRPDILIWTGYAHVFRVDKNGKEITERWLRGRTVTELSLPNICDDVPLLTARFCHRSLFDQFGNYDPEFSECSDREFLLRLYMAGVVDAPLDVPVSSLRLHDRSRTINTRQNWVPPYLSEHIKLAGRWLQKDGLKLETRRFLTNWRAREILRLCYYNYRAGHLWKAVTIALSAEISDPLWGFRALSVLRASLYRQRSDG